MSKTSVAKKSDPSDVLVLDDFFEGASTGFEGVGVEDTALPRLTILQALSQQLSKRSDDYVEGASAGDIYNTATGLVVPSKSVVFAAYQRRYVEWVPRSRGGGLVADHGTSADILESCVHNDEDGSWWHGDNEVVVTGTWYTIDPTDLSMAFIAMAKTHFSASKKIMAMVRDVRVHTAKGVVPAPIYARVWDLSSRVRTNDKGEWYTWRATPGALISELDNGRAILDAVKTVQQWVGEDKVKVDLSAGEHSSDADSGSTF